MIVRTMRGPYAFWRASAELNVLASLRLRNVISTLASNCVTYQVTFYLYLSAENKRNPTREWMDRTRRRRSGSGAVALFPADRSRGDRAGLRPDQGGRDARAPGGQKYRSNPTRALTPLASSDKGTVTPTSVKGMILEALR